MTVNVSTYHHPYRVSVPWRSTGQWRDLQIWLLDNVPRYADYVFIGADIKNTRNRIYCFAYEKDAALFTLRWA